MASADKSRLRVDKVGDYSLKQFSDADLFPERAGAKPTKPAIKPAIKPAAASNAKASAGVVAGAARSQRTARSDLYGGKTLELTAAAARNKTGRASASGVAAVKAGGSAATATGAAGAAYVGDAVTHEARLRLAFEAIDVDGTQQVGKRELYDALRRVGVSGSSHQMLGLFREAHRDSGSQEPLKWAEFRALGFQLPALALLGKGKPAEQLAADQIHMAPRR